MENKQKGIFALALAGSTVFVIGLFAAVCWNARIIQNNTDRMAAQPLESQQAVPESNSPEIVEDQPIPTANWQDFVSRKCGFSFMYPPTLEVSVWGIEQSEENPVKAIDICTLKATESFHIFPMSIPDPSPLPGRGYNPDKITPAQVKNWDAEMVAKKILEINQAYNRLRRAENPEIPSYDSVTLEEVQLKGRKAYQFTLEGDVYIDWSSEKMTDSQRAFNSPVQKVPSLPKTLTFVSDNQGQVYLVDSMWVREYEREYAKTILSTLEFFN